MTTNQNGIALVIVLVFTASLMAFGATLLNFGFTEKRIVDYYTEDIVIFYITESGIEVGLAVLMEDFYSQSIIHGSMEEGDFAVSFVEVAPEQRLIISEGRIGTSIRQLKVLVENDPVSGLVIKEWLGE